ncbi:Hypothetical protein R9X50_00260400 [Acrodontium crateriforme]|uniref:Protein kinase domain-containing protein n=1 Tax=Acrodontium crateriforme TaxID=150365 RepID=A0AAQ3M4K4_9PEZI|nr:Hypothetical protein R9X50_00260400 [Acrodontium crateriforme]
MAVSPQAIPEGKVVDHSVSPLMSPYDSFDMMSRNNSTRSLRSASRPTRIPNSRRSSRRSTSQNPSPSPAHAFLASWAASREDSYSGSNPEPKPDDEGQAIGMNNEYIIGPTINHGGFGVVKEVHTIGEHGHRTVRAVKIVRKAISGKSEIENDQVQQQLEHEVSVWRYLKHRHILELHAVYDTDFATFCVMDLNIGGTLFDMVRRSRADANENDGRKGLQPKLAKSYAFQLACALRYLHEDIRVCHRDIKLENCLVNMSQDASTGGGVLRLCDFGLSDFLHHDQGLDDMSPEGAVHMSPTQETDVDPVLTTSSVIGTLEYASPRGLSVHHKLFETAGDVWAFGVIVYALCTGELPFRHHMPAKTVELIMQAEYDHEALRQAAAGSDAVIDLVKGCLERDVDLRLTIGEVLRSPWFEGCREDDDEHTRDVWR